jgi:hypothetical protein
VFAALLCRPALIPRQNIGPALPLTTLVAWAGLLIALIRCRRDSAAVTRLMPLVLWSTFAGVMLSKMLLNARLHHYGFYLAMPATLTLVVSLIWAVPRLLRRGPRGAPLFRGLAFAGVAASAVAYARLSCAYYAVKGYQVGRGGDAISTYVPEVSGVGLAVNEALAWIEHNTAPEAGLVAFPEGIMLNYLSRRVDPTPYTNFMMVELQAFGEDAILAGLRAHQPDFVVLVHKDTSEFGVRFFGTDPRYGKTIMDWIKAEYENAQRIGFEPLKDERFGIKILKRRAGVHATRVDGDDRRRAGAERVNAAHPSRAIEDCPLDRSL